MLVKEFIADAVVILPDCVGHCRRPEAAQTEALSPRAEQSKADRRATATHYCFGGNRDCGGARCTGLDESCVETCAGCSCVETCTGCCAGFGSGVWTGLSARGEDESRAMLCWEICSWVRVS